jgi:hypothetical protein
MHPMFKKAPIRMSAATLGAAALVATPAVAIAATQKSGEEEDRPRTRTNLIQPGPFGLNHELHAIALERTRVVDRSMKVARRVAKLSGDRTLVRKHRRKLKRWSNDGIRRSTRKLRATERELKAEQAAEREAQRLLASASVSNSTLESIAACESGGDPTAIGGGGAYRGKYQFDQSTWESVGGTGDPAAAPEAEQDARAAMLYERSGSSPWPNCG